MNQPFTFVFGKLMIFSLSLDIVEHVLDQELIDVLIIAKVYEIV